MNSNKSGKNISRPAAVIAVLALLLGAGYFFLNKQTAIMKPVNGYVVNIEKLSLANDNFRQVLYTDKNSQLVLMSLLPKEEIGAEVHDVDQFLRVEKGTGKAILNDISHDITDGSAIVVPAGTKHNIVNTGTVPMKLYVLYMPPHHRDGVVHKTKAAAEADNEHFEGVTTEK